MKTRIIALFTAVIGLFLPALNAGNLKINLAPSQAVSAGAQWRVDGGVWENSGEKVNGLSNGTHQVTFSTVNGWIAPAPANVTVTNGTTTLSFTYTQASSLSVTLNPGSAQWRVDGNAWLNSGTTVSNLTPGSHSIEYSSLSQYAPPPDETVTLSAGQSLTLQRDYTQLAQILIGLVPNTGQWRANGGAWQDSGASLFVLPGNYAIEYASLADYDPPANESISLAAADVFATTRYYVSTKPTLQVNLTPDTAQWRVDGGAWQSSGTLIAGLEAGSHTIDYTDIGGAYDPLPSETISLALRENASLARNYPLKPPAAVTVVLDPTFAQWRVDGGDWQPSGTTVGNLTYDVTHLVEYQPIDGYVAPGSESFTPASGEQRTLIATFTPLASVNVSFEPATVYAQWRLNGGDWQYPATTLNNLPYDVPHTVEFSPVEGYVTPPSQSFTLTSGEQRTLIATYSPLASVNVSFEPATVYAQWRLNGGDWQYPATTLNNLPYDVPHTVEFSPVEGYVAPPSQSFTLTSGEQRTLIAVYSPGGAGVGQLTVTLTPSSAQWRVDGGVWQASGATVADLGSGGHLIEYSPLAGMASPADETVSLSPEEHLSLDRNYTVASYIATGLNPGNGGPSVGLGINLAGMIAGRAGNRAFRYANGVMQDLGTLSGAESEAYGLNDAGMVVGQTTHSGGGSFHAFLHDGTMHDLGAISTTSNGGYSQAIAINASGVIVGRSGVENFRTHAFRYSGGVMEDLGTLNPGYGDSAAHAINDAGVIVGYSDVNPGEGRAFRYSGGIMQDLGTLGGASSVARAINESGVIVGDSTLADHRSHAFRYSNGVMIDLGTLEGPEGSFSRAQGINESGDIVGVSGVVGDDLPHAFIIYNGGAMQDLNTLVETVLGVYFYDSFGINDLGQIIVSGSDGRSYLLTPINAPGGLQTTLNHADARWRVDGGAWQTGGSPVLDLAIGDHIIEYNAVAGHISPATETVTVSSGRLLQLNRSYTVVP